MAKQVNILYKYNLEGTDNLEYIVYKPQPHHEIFNADLPKKEQKWKRQDTPNFDNLTKKECADYFKREILRIKHGVYAWINGDLIYITGKHYFALTHWKLKESTTDYLIYTKTQRNIFYFFDLCEKDSKCVGGIVFSLKRLGKALDINTDIPTLDGWKKMSDIHVGDYVFGLDGEKTRVIKETSVMLNRDCYRIEFCDKTEVIADGEHIWIASDAKDRYKNVPSNEYNPYNSIQAREVTTLEMFNTQKSKQGNSNWSIRNSSAVNYEKKDLKIPPYILGLWLGDGSSYDPKITNIDKEIIDDWTAYGESIGLKVVRDGEYSYALSSGRELKTRANKGRNKFKTFLQEYNLIKNKHIPIDYLTSSIDDRIELLRGIMDTDGSKHKDINLFEVCMKKKSFQEECYILITSLGIKARMFSKHNKKFDKTYYYINFSTYDINPFKLTRKADKFRLKSNRKGGIVNEFRYIKNIEKVESVPVKCIEVDNESKTYLCTKSFIVTHNSELAQAEMFADAILSDSGVYVVQALNDDEAIDIFGKTHFANEHLHETLPVWMFKHTKASPPSGNLVVLNRHTTSDSIVWKSADGKSATDAINFMVKPTKLSGIQGKKLKRAFLDEFASLKPVKDMTLANWHSKAVAQCTEDFGSRVLGKLWLIATAENMTSESLADAQIIYDDSAEDRKDENGFTPSTLKRMFIPYYLGGRGEQFIDEYGNPKIEEAKKWYANKIKGLSEGAKVLFRRQNPETIDDVFAPMDNGGLEADCVEILTDHLKNLQKIRHTLPIQYVNLYMDNGELRKTQKKAESEDEQAKWIEIIEDPRPNVTYVVGVDGTNTSKQTSETVKKKSKFAIVVKKLFEGVDNENYMTVANYAVIPERMEDLIKMVYYLTILYNKFDKCTVMAEGNVGIGDAIVSYFTQMGVLKLLRKQPKYFGTESKEVKNRYTVYADEHVNKESLRLLNIWVRRHGRNEKSTRIIKDWIKVGTTNTDFASASRVALLGCGNFDPETQKVKKVVVKGKRRQQLTYVGGTWKYEYV